MGAESAVLELRLVGDITGRFRVPRYQRGYRWGEPEVTRLLNDIWESQDKPYSLQPVVVKRDSEATWELIDGQQRLTTLYLIFAYMQRARFKNVGPQYTISYDTRPQSADYLDTLDPALAGTNIDFFQPSTAYACIEAWFEQKGPMLHKRQGVADDIFRYLCKSVRVIRRRRRKTRCAWAPTKSSCRATPTKWTRMQEPSTSSSTRSPRRMT